MKRFFKRLFILLLPLFIIVFIFLSLDPMRVVKNYESPLLKGPLINDRVFQARWLEKHKLNYNSYIFGSSRSKAFHTKDWKKYIEKNAIPFHMGVNDETIYGIEKKIKFLLKKNYEINNVLLILDHRVLSRSKPMETHLFRDPPQYTGETFMSFYKRFVIAFLNPSFLKSFYKYKTSGEINGRMMMNLDFKYNNKTADCYYLEYETQLKKNEDAFYEKYNTVFYERKQSKPVAIIDKQSLQILQSIGKILNSLNVNYKVVINPWYDQKKLDTADLNVLTSIFKKENVFDYSGVNDITNNKRNYYESKHFRPFVGKQILKEIY